MTELLLLWLLVQVAAPAAAPPLQRYEAVEPAMGTLFRITLYAHSAAEARAAFEAAFARAHELNAKFSDYQPDSELNLLCRAGGGPVSEELFAVLERALEVARFSRGAFDPTLGPLTRLWRASRKAGQLPSPAALSAARRLSGWKKVRLDRHRRTVALAVAGMQLDLGGIAKGFAAAELLRLLASRGLPASLVAASGDLAIGEPPPGRAGWTIGLEAAQTNELLARCGVSTSGSEEQFVEVGGIRYSHILDPRTGLGLTGGPGRLTVSVIAPDATLADGLATMAAVAGPAKAKTLIRRWKGVRLVLSSPPLP